MTSLDIRMIVGTTPTLELTLSDSSIDLSTYSHVYVTLRSNRYKVLTKKNADLVLDGNICAVSLTQKETLFLGTGRCKVQMNWTSDSGAYRDASEIGEFTLSENLMNEVLA